MDLDLVFSDDGLQQGDLVRDIEFCVVDGERGLGNGHLIPAGPLRETAERLRQVDYVVTNGEWAGKPDNVDVNVMHLQASVVHSLDGATEYSLDDFRQNHTGTPIHAVAGIGNPQRFFDLLRAHGMQVIEHAYPDHAVIDTATLNFDDDFDILMTEKDAVKLGTKHGDMYWYVPVDLDMDPVLAGPWLEQIESRMKDEQNRNG